MAKKHVLYREVNNDFLIGIVLGIIVSVLFMGIFMATFKNKMDKSGLGYFVETVDDTSMTNNAIGY